MEAIHRRVLAALFTAVALSAPYAAAQEATKFIWQSESGALAQLPKDITTLYSTLLGAGKLPLQKYVDEEGETIEQIMRDKKLFFGTYFPVELDRLMCSLNRPVCTEAGGVKGKEAEGAGKPTRAIWSNKAGGTLVLPAIDFQPYVAPKPYEKKKGERIENIAVNIRQGCENFDEECRQFIKNLNPRKPELFEASFEGTVIVPTLALRAEITLAKPRDREPASGVNKNAVIQQKLDKNVVPRILMKPRSAHAGGPLFEKQKPVFSLIRHPFLSDAPLPSTYPVTVAVFDTWVDGTHCGFGVGSDERIDAHNESPGEPPEQAACGSDGTPNPIADHGTHVAGIIGAKTNTGGPVGINPQAKVVTYEIHHQEFTNPVAATKAADTITKTLRKYAAQIFNFSFEYTGDKRTGDPIEGRITALANILFVASAGNDKANMSTLCSVRPACLSLPNVISVVALNLSEDDPQLWTTADGRSGSNYGTMFDIGAPGENVISTIRYNRYGALSGTSQAAPLISGAASLLLAKDSKLMPVQLKQRLIYTSDLFENLDDKILGGRLNIDRALAYEDDLVTLKNGTTLKGTVRKSFTVYYEHFEEAERSAVRLGNIIRLNFNDRRKTYTMMTLSDPPKEKFTKQTNVVVLRHRQKVTMQIREGGAWRPREFEVTDIKDYVSALKAH